MGQLRQQICRYFEASGHIVYNVRCVPFDNTKGYCVYVYVDTMLIDEEQVVRDLKVIVKNTTNKQAQVQVPQTIGGKKTTAMSPQKKFIVVGVEPIYEKANPKTTI